MTGLAQRIDARPSDLGEVARYLDDLDPATRREEAGSLGKRAQAWLFEAAEGSRPLDLTHFVPPSVAPMSEVVHHGRNSLPLFTRFAKVFCRPDGPEADAGELWGYNRNPAVVETTVGPGYFVARSHDAPGEILIDYLRVPPRKPDHWPPILPNEARLSRFVYNGTQDVMRGVSTHVSIGRATKAGKPMDAWFILCRED